MDWCKYISTVIILHSMYSIAIAHSVERVPVGGGGGGACRAK